MNRTKTIQSLTDSDRVLQYVGGIVLRHILAAAAGFLCACASFDGLAPFGVALAAAVFPEYIPAAVLGSTAGYFRIYGMTVLTLRYIAAAAVAGILAYLLKRSFKRNYHPVFSAVCGFFPLFVTGLILSLSVTLSIDEVILYAAESAVCSLAAWFFSCFLAINPAKKYAAGLSGRETASVLILFAVLLLALSSFSLFILSPAVIVGTYVVLVSACFGGDKYGALTGIFAGVVLGLSGQSGFLTGGIAMGGLLVGIFGKKNRFLSAVILLLTVSVTAFASDDWIDAANVLYGVGIACIALLLTPKKLRKIYQRIFSLSSDGAFLTGQRNVLKTRLQTASDGMTSVASSVKAVAGIYKRRAFPREEKIYENVAKKVCASCDNCRFCRKENKIETDGWFHDVADELKRCDSPETRELPPRFLSVCLMPERVIKELRLEIERYRNAMRETAKTGETVNIVADQFQSVSELLGSFSAVMDSGEEYDPERSELVRAMLEKDYGVTPVSCGVFRTQEEHRFCELCLPAGQYDSDALRESIAGVLTAEWEAPVTGKLADGSITFTVCEKTKYRMESGGFQLSSDGAKWCGDTFRSFSDGKGHFIMILSDGMGTGKKAAADSVLCCSLTTMLLGAGYPVDCILKMINSAMLVRSGEESLATLDIAVTDLYSGDVEFYKAGAGSSVAMRHLKLLRLSKPSLPIGILQNIAFEKISLSLRDGDSFVLMSDGVSEESVSAWRDLLKDAADYEGKELAEKLAYAARLNADKESPDDITVLTATLLLNDE